MPNESPKGLNFLCDQLVDNPNEIRQISRWRRYGDLGIPAFCGYEPMRSAQMAISLLTLLDSDLELGFTSPSKRVLAP